MGDIDTPVFGGETQGLDCADGGAGAVTLGRGLVEVQGPVLVVLGAGAFED